MSNDDDDDDDDGDGDSDDGSPISRENESLLWQ